MRVSVWGSTCPGGVCQTPLHEQNDQTGVKHYLTAAGKNFKPPPHSNKRKNLNTLPWVTSWSYCLVCTLHISLETYNSGPGLYYSFLLCWHCLRMVYRGRHHPLLCSFRRDRQNSPCYLIQIPLCNLV